MVARFGAKIIPFGVVGEDDLGEVSFGPFWTNPFASQIYYGLKILVSGKEWPIVFMESIIHVNYLYLQTSLYEL